MPTNTPTSLPLHEPPFRPVRTRRCLYPARTTAVSSLRALLSETFPSIFEPFAKCIRFRWAEFTRGPGRYRQVNLIKDDLPFAAAAQIPQLMQTFEEGPLRRHTPCDFQIRDL
jgi:hypothetical protein